MESAGEGICAALRLLMDESALVVGTGMGRTGSYILKLLVCQLALLGVSSAAHAGVVAPVSGTEFAPPLPALTANGASESSEAWVPYLSEFREASQLLIVLAQSKDGFAVQDDGPTYVPEGMNGSDGLPAAELLRSSRLLEICVGLKILLAAMGMGSPASSGATGTYGPPVPQAGCLSISVPVPPDAVEPLIARIDQFPILVLASRLFRPPRAADANCI